MTAPDALEQGRASFAQHQWTDAHARLSAADQDTPLEPEDLERLATASSLIGRDSDTAELWTRAHREYLTRGNVERAARCAFWLAFGLLNKGKRARSSGWIARASRVLDTGARDCVERGYLLLPAALQCLAEGDVPGAHMRFCEAAGIGDRYGDKDLVSLARVGSGRALIRMDNISEGVSQLDEAMIAAEAGEVSPMALGEVYCSVIEGCLEVFDLRRAQEWTAALSDWCETQPDLVPYTGQCSVRRAEILQLHGAWPDAIRAAKQAGERFRQGPDQSGSGAAFYQQAELHRVRGEFDEAEEAYREGARRGRTPHPGLAQLRLSQGQIDLAAAAIRGALNEAQDRRTRSRLLPAYVEIMVASGDQQAARSGADELLGIADAIDAPFLRAVSAYAHGAVLLATHDVPAAVTALRQAWTIWQEIEAPYEAARARVLIGIACGELGDSDGAEMEFDAARWVFRQLGAVPEVARVETLSRIGATVTAGGLTRREVQVLRLVASGKTNRGIARGLFISEKTVARHMSNIFTKLDLATRAAATAYAYRHGLIDGVAGKEKA